MPVCVSVVNGEKCWSYPQCKSIYPECKEIHQMSSCNRTHNTLQNRGGVFQSKLWCGKFGPKFTVQPETCLCITVVSHTLSVWRLTIGSGPCPCLGPVWAFLQNIIEPIVPDHGPVQCEYTITVDIFGEIQLDWWKQLLLRFRRWFFL